MRHARYFLLGFWLVAATVQAETQADLFALSLQELGRLDVSIATGMPKPLHMAPAVASVITAQELDSMGAQSLEEALETVPGLHVSNSNIQYSPRYFMRGIVATHNPHTLLLVNGIPHTSLLLGDRGEHIPGRYSLPVALIERIEIIRGPGSALYGADAFAGVINVITKGPGDIEGSQARLSAGSFDTGSATLQQAGTLGPARAALTLSYFHTQGDTPTIAADAQTGIDSFGQTLGAPPASRAPGPAELSTEIFNAQTEAQWGDFRWRMAWMQTDDTGTGQGIVDALDPSSRFLHRRGSSDLTWHKPLADWELEAQLSYLYSDRHGRFLLFPPGAFFGSFPEGVIGQVKVAEENARSGFTALYQGWDRHRLRLGTGFYWGDLFQTRDVNNYRITDMGIEPRGGFADVSDTSAIFQPEAQRTSYYGFIQDEWAFAPDWELTAGLRHDRYSDFGATTNPRLALVWQATPTLTGKLLYGEAFRPPAFWELYVTVNAFALGNPRLQPEKLRSLELALAGRPNADWAWDLNLYQLRIRDFIDFVADDPSQATFTAQNRSRIKGHGLEAEARYQAFPGLQLLANYSYQHTEDEDSGQALGLAPRDKAYLRLSWDFAANWQLTPQLTWIGERKRQAGDARPDLDGYTTVDFTLRKRWPRGIALALIARNLFDADVREPSRGPGPGQAAPALPDDLPQAGRSLTLEARTHW